MAIAGPFGTNVAAGATVNKPASTAVGDVLLIAVHAAHSADAAVTGFTVVKSHDAFGLGFARVTTLKRVADGSEGATFTATGGTVYRTAIARFTGVDSAVTEGTPTDAEGLSGGACVFPSITTVSANAMLVIFSAAGHGGNVTDISTPTGMTEQFENGTGGSTAMALDTQTIASAGATGTRSSTTTYSGGDGHQYGVMLALKPAASGTPATVDAALATATAAMQVPTIAAEATVAAPLMTATAAMLTPSVGVANGVTAPVLTATAQLLAPTVTAEANVAAPLLTATAAMQTPVVSIDVVVAPNAPMTATATMLDPTITAAATVSAPVLTATAAFLAPVVSGEVWIDAPLLTASAELLAPSVIAEAVVGDVPVLTSSAELLAPFVGVAPPTVPWHGGQMQSGTQRGVRGTVSARPGVTGTVRQRAGVTMKETL